MKPILIITLFLTVYSVSNAQIIRPNPCSSTTNTISGNGSNTVVQSDYYTGSVTFRTNCVVGATSYLWAVGGGGAMSTSSNSVTFEASDLVWLPPGGCDEFNSNLTSDSYNTTMTVSANNTSSSATIAVVISGVGKCKNFDPWKLKNK